MSYIYLTDSEKMNLVKKYLSSGLGVREFSEAVGIPRRSLQDWIYAYDNIDCSFLNLNKVLSDNQSATFLFDKDEKIEVKILNPNEISKKSHHFTRFDRSIIVIEFGNKLKVTSSLEHALKILEDYYARSN